MPIQSIGSGATTWTRPSAESGSSQHRPWIEVRSGQVLHYSLREHLDHKIIDIKPGESRTVVLPRGERLGDIDAGGAAGLQMTVRPQGSGVGVTFRLRDSVPAGTEFPITATERTGGYVVAPRDGWAGVGGAPPPEVAIAEGRKVRFIIRAT